MKSALLAFCQRKKRQYPEKNKVIHKFIWKTNNPPVQFNVYNVVIIVIKIITKSTNLFSVSHLSDYSDYETEMIEGASDGDNPLGMDGVLDLHDGTVDIIPDVVDGLCGEVPSNQACLPQDRDERSAVLLVVYGIGRGGVGIKRINLHVADAVRKDGEPGGRQGERGTAAPMHHVLELSRVNRSVRHHHARRVAASLLQDELLVAAASTTTTSLRQFEEKWPTVRYPHWFDHNADRSSDKNV